MHFINMTAITIQISRDKLLFSPVSYNKEIIIHPYELLNLVTLLCIEKLDKRL